MVFSPEWYSFLSLSISLFLAQTSTSNQPSWRPLILKPIIAILFSLTILILVAVLEILVYISRNHSGFPIPPTALYFPVTYTPVALIIFVGWVWQILDLEVKKLVPWLALSKGPTALEDSLLLDYIGANPFSTIINGVRRKHYRVVVSTLGRWVTAGTVVAATSLWVIAPVQLVESIPLVYTEAFNGSAFDNFTDGSFLFPYLGHQLYDIPIPSWTFDQYVFDPFVAEDTPGNAILSGTTRGSKADLDCQQASVQLSGSFSVIDAYNITGNAFSTMNIPVVDVVLGDCRETFNITTYKDLGNKDRANLADDVSDGESSDCHSMYFTYLCQVFLLGTHPHTCLGEFES
jgi:hypothetical protein